MKNFLIYYLLVTACSTLIGHGFSVHTLIHVADGSCIEIEQLCRQTLHKKVIVATYDNKGGFGSKSVKRCGRSKTEQFINVWLEGHDKITCTPVQEFYRASTKQWVPAYKLKIGDVLFCKNVNKSISYVEYVKKRIDVFIFEMPRPHTFFVGRSGVLTHNMALPIVWSIGASVSLGTVAGSSLGSFFGPVTLMAGAVVGSLIGVCVSIVQHDHIPKYSFESINIHLFDEYLQRNQRSTSVDSNGGTISSTPDGPKKDDEEEKKYEISDKDKNHIFRNSEGHFSKDTPESRAIIESMVNKKGNFKGFDKYGNEVYLENLPDGFQIWAKARNGQIRWAGKNAVPWSYELGIDLIRPLVKN